MLATSTTKSFCRRLVAVFEYAPGTNSQQLEIPIPRRSARRMDRAAP